jgi:hypothetical protein
MFKGVSPHQMTENKTITFFLTIDYRSNGGFSVLKEKND